MQLHDHLQLLENRLHASADDIDETARADLIADDFIEFSLSGSIWDKRFVLEALGAAAPAPRSVADFQVRLLAPSIALVTYRAHRAATGQRPAADSLRSSLWRLSDGRWQMTFHQATATA